MRKGSRDLIDPGSIGSRLTALSSRANRSQERRAEKPRQFAAVHLIFSAIRL
jgi:hypothetical protein